MNVKTYLLQLKRIDVQMQQLISEKEFLESQLTSTTIRPKEIQVMSSMPQDPMGDSIIKLMELEHAINERYDRLINLRQTIVAQIQAMDDPLQMQILYKRYVEYKRWEIIELEMHYSFQHLQRIHKKALKTFEYKHEIK